VGDTHLDYDRKFLEVNSLFNLPYQNYDTSIFSKNLTSESLYVTLTRTTAENFEQNSSRFNLPCKIAMELTFENFHLFRNGG